MLYDIHKQANKIPNIMSGAYFITLRYLTQIKDGARILSSDER